MIEAFIFDMDGVIIDSEPIHFDVDVKTLRYFGVSIKPEYLEQYVGMTNPEMWRVIKQEFNLPQPVSEIIEYQLSSKIEVIRTTNIQPMSGIVGLISELMEHKIPLAVASSSPPTFISAVLHKLELFDYFDCVVSGEEVEHGKPAPDVYLKAARLLGVKPEQCYVLEDSRNGVAAAKAAGMNCIGFINPSSGTQDLSKADSIVKRIADIKVKELMKD